MTAMNGHSMNQLVKINKKFIVVLAIGMWVATHSLWGADAWAKASSKTKRSLSQELYNVGGFGREKRILSKKGVTPNVLTQPRILRALGMSNEHVALVNDVYKRTFKASDFYSKKLKQIRNNYNRRHITQSIRFFRSAVGRKFVRLNAQKLTKSQRAYHNFLNKVVKKMPKNKRLQLFDQFERAVNGVDQLFDYQNSVLRLTNPVNRQFNAPHADVLVNRLRSELREQFRSWMILRYMFDYQSLSNRELKKLVAFFRSPAGQWFNSVDHKGNLAGFATVNRKALRRMEKILKVLESGRQDIQTTKVVFAPGLRYMFSEKRDPFDPLIVPEEEKKKKKGKRAPAAAPKPKDGKPTQSAVVVLATKIDGLPAIPYELYRRIKESNPRLYSDLEYYGALFRNKRGLQGMKMSELEEEIKQYNKLINRAREETELLVQTPLQSRFGQLRLAGVIWDEQETVGLIQTPDGKGHTIRVGSFVGPDFGVVQSIGLDRVVVLEQLRKYDGKIVTQTRFIEFPKPDEEE